MKKFINLGKLLHRARLENGYTQEQLGLKLNLTSQNISKWERGLSVPPSRRFHKLIEVLRLNKKELGDAIMEDTMALIRGKTFSNE